MQVEAALRHQPPSSQVVNWESVEAPWQLFMTCSVESGGVNMASNSLHGHHYVFNDAKEAMRHGQCSDCLVARIKPLPNTRFLIKPDDGITLTHWLDRYNPAYGIYSAGSDGQFAMQVLRNAGIFTISGIVCPRTGQTLLLRCEDQPLKVQFAPVSHSSANDYSFRSSTSRSLSNQLGEIYA